MHAAVELNLPLPRIESTVARDGYRFFVRVWNSAADRPPPARVFFLHGIVSHGGWYAWSCARIAAAGFEVHFLDRRGSGLNAAARGDVDSPETWVRDVADYTAAASCDGQPAILAGISWGGKLALAVAARHPGLLSGLALICPGVFSKYGASRAQRWGVGLASRTPARTRRVLIPLQDPHLFTDDPSWQRSIERDPLVLRQLTLRAARANLELGHYAENAENVPTIPILLMLAGRDGIIDNARMRGFFHRLASQHKQLVEYPEAAHTLDFDPVRRAYVDDLTAWCGQISGQQRTLPAAAGNPPEAKKTVERVT
jgi:alpha-beta hydrolase superfamily lysophospholipase